MALTKIVLPVVPTQTVEGVAGELQYCRSLCECGKMLLPLVICLFAALEIHEATGQPAGIVQLNCGGKRMKSVAVPLYSKDADLSRQMSNSRRVCDEGSKEFEHR